jgi:hypothetical protein
MATASCESIADWPEHGWRDATDRLVAVLRAWNVPTRRVNWYIRWLESPADAEDEMVPAAEVEARGGFPAAWVNLTYDPERVAGEDLADLEDRFGLRRYAEARSRANYFP